ncbi:ModD protein [Zoogloea sp. LCSB751]|uniref:ModD protein n=1 Tax=Zoogloea sp. LCSB751 TaxID=1965277 RepID=UPI0020B10573|nr:ModD protein [Zoogloea sp. LCSB751]
MMSSFNLPDATLLALLADDVSCGDLTTVSLGIGVREGRVVFRARGAMTVCGSEEATRLFELAGARARLWVSSGSHVEAGRLLLEAEGTADSLHAAWKTGQVLMEWASGLATAAAAIVKAAEAGGRRVAVACTRKNVPGAKAMSVKAVRAGGATIHRLGLSESLLVFAEHRLFLAETPAQTVKRLRAREPEKKIVVEVGSVAEAAEWARAGADVLQLEKFSVGQVAECRQLVNALAPNGRGAPLLAAAGGVKADNAAAFVAAGADLLVTSAPYTAAPADVAVSFELPSA